MLVWPNALTLMAPSSVMAQPGLDGTRSTVRGQGRATWIKKTASTLKTQFDAVVVGSGPGGATVTRELASDGWKLLILERGQRKPVTGTMWA